MVRVLSSFRQFQNFPGKLVTNGFLTQHVRRGLEPRTRVMKSYSNEAPESSFKFSSPAASVEVDPRTAERWSNNAKMAWEKLPTEKKRKYKIGIGATVLISISLIYSFVKNSFNQKSDASQQPQTGINMPRSTIKGDVNVNQKFIAGSNTENHFYLDETTIEEQNDGIHSVSDDMGKEALNIRIGNIKKRLATAKENHQLNKLRISLANIYYRLNKISIDEKDVVAAKKYLKKAQRSLDKVKLKLELDGVVKANFLNVKGMIYQGLSREEENSRVKLGDTKKGWWCIIFGGCDPSEQAKEAMECYKNSLEIFECLLATCDANEGSRSYLDKMIARLNNNIGNVYLYLFRKPQDAIGYFKKAIEIEEKRSGCLNTSQLIWNLRDAYIDSDQVDTWHEINDQCVRKCIKPLFFKSIYKTMYICHQLRNGEADPEYDTSEYRDICALSKR